MEGLRDEIVAVVKLNKPAKLQVAFALAEIQGWNSEYRAKQCPNSSEDTTTGSENHIIASINGPIDNENANFSSNLWESGRVAFSAIMSTEGNSNNGGKYEKSIAIHNLYQPYDHQSEPTPGIDSSKFYFQEMEIQYDAAVHQEEIIQYNGDARQLSTNSSSPKLTNEKLEFSTNATDDNEESITFDIANAKENIIQAKDLIWHSDQVLSWKEDISLLSVIPLPSEQTFGIHNKWFGSSDFEDKFIFAYKSENMDVMDIVLVPSHQSLLFFDHLLSWRKEENVVLFEYEEDTVGDIESQLIQRGFKAQDHPCDAFKRLCGEVDIMARLVPINIHILKRASDFFKNGNTNGNKNNEEFYIPATEEGNILHSEWVAKILYETQGIDIFERTHQSGLLHKMCKENFTLDFMLFRKSFTSMLSIEVETGNFSLLAAVTAFQISGSKSVKFKNQRLYAKACNIIEKSMIVIWGWYYKEVVNFFDVFKATIVSSFQLEKHPGQWNIPWMIAWLFVHQNWANVQN